MTVMSEGGRKRLRGRILTFNRKPEGPGDRDAYSYLEDGVITFENGKIESLKPAGDGSTDAERIDGLIIPGLIDTHLHFPQVQIIGASASGLLDWLDRHTFPGEIAYSDPDHAERMAIAFFDRLLAHGTTTPVAYCASYPISVDAYFGEAERRGIAAFGGKTCMDRNAPEALCDTAERAYSESKDLIDRWHGRGRLEYVITPRFAITSTPDQLSALGALASEHPDLLVQTHMSETKAEIAEVERLYPDARDYLDVYEKAGLLSSRLVLGHTIHLTEREVDRMAESGAVAAHCPTSNLFLGSGLLNLDRLERANVRTALATDIGGGTSWSMMRTMDAAFKIQMLQGRRLDPLETFYLATLGNAQALGAADRIGTLEPGTDADVVVLDAKVTPEMQLRMEVVESLEDELFLLQTLGDDRSIRQVYVAGQLAVDNS